METANPTRADHEGPVHLADSDVHARTAGIPEVLLVTSTDWVGFSRVPRILHLAGARVTAMGLAHSQLSQSKFVATFFPVPGDPDAVRDQLLSHLTKHPQKYAWVCIGDDPLFRSVSLSDDPIIGSWFPIERTDAMRSFIESKWEFMARCAEAGLNVAPFEICHDAQSARDAAMRIGFPLVVKLMQSVGASGVLPANDSDELDRILAAHPGTVALQAFVTGKPFATEVLYDRGVPLCWTSSEQINRWPRSLGPSSARRTIYVEGNDHVVRTIGKITGFHGICAIDAILPDDGGTPMMCELNPRPTPGHTADDEARGLYAAALANFLAGKHPTIPFTQDRQPPRAISMFPESLYYLIEKPQERMRWEFAFRALGNAPFDDQRLFWHIVRKFSTHLIERTHPRAALRSFIRSLTGRKPKS